MAASCLIDSVGATRGFLSNSGRNRIQTIALLSQRRLTLGSQFVGLPKGACTNVRCHHNGLTSKARHRSTPGSRVSRAVLSEERTQQRTAEIEEGAPQETGSDFLSEILRKEFPILNQDVNGQRLVYLDNAATSQKPLRVMRAMDDYYERYNSNVHRGVHTLSALATDEYEAARAKVARFVNAPSSRDVVFTRNASEAINLVAYTWGQQNVKQGDEIVLSVAEHHSNLVPWQMLAQRTGAVLKFAGLAADERIDEEELLGLIGSRTKLVAIHHVSNTLGSCIPVEKVVARAHEFGAKVLLDACQSVPHMGVDVQKMDVDFMAVSSHKMCGPTGIGFLYGRGELLREMPPFMGGGEMISEVLLERSTYAQPPSRFEAGTPAIAEAVGLGAAVDFLLEIGMEELHRHENALGSYLYSRLREVPGVRIYGPPPSADGSGRAALCSFTVEGVHATDLSTFLDQQHGIAIRSGHHCTQPLHRLLGIPATARASLYLYNTRAEVDVFVAGLQDTIDFFTSFASSSPPAPAETASVSSTSHS
eukprot:TRINITY_DN10782_c0_g1_i1.p1 TRINITY_DN10782_c0_g1~~TRINITY_DN10782_c0_g1_i1.p1  ORF type:complete len:535 (+),score=90.77 TRINITY_DN10782_c0_g1_i1:204-1808(+)